MMMHLDIVTSKIPRKILMDEHEPCGAKTACQVTGIVKHDCNEIAEWMGRYDYYNRHAKWSLYCRMCDILSHFSW